MTTATQPTPAQIAQAAREAADLIRDPDRWIANTWGETPDGYHLDPHELPGTLIARCNRWCAGGAFLYRLLLNTGSTDGVATHDGGAIEQAVWELHPECDGFLGRVNDEYGREAAIRVLERAAELAEQQAQA